MASTRVRKKVVTAQHAARAAGPGDYLVGARILAARKSAELSQHELAKAIGVARQQIQKYEEAVNRVAPDRLQKIADATGKPITYFFADMGPNTKDNEEVRMVVKLLGSNRGMRRLLRALVTPKDANLLAAIAERMIRA